MYIYIYLRHTSVADGLSQNRSRANRFIKMSTIFNRNRNLSAHESILDFWVQIIEDNNNNNVSDF